MSLHLTFLIICSVTMSAAAQIMLRQGMRLLDPRVGPATYILDVIMNLQVQIGLAVYGGSMVLWLLVLSKIEVTRAYPFVGLGFVLTMAFGVLYLNESFHYTKLVGTALIVAGIWFINCKA